MTIRWVDNHCHLSKGQDGDDQIAAAKEQGVVRFIDVGVTAERSRQSVEIAQRHPGVVWAAVGVHPHDATEGAEGIVPLLGETGVVAVGECGLDYHYDHSPRDIQKQVFADQIQLAHEHDLPLVIHTRSAWDDTFDVLDAEGVPSTTIFHCFTGGPDEARKGLDRGAVLSFSGILTFKTGQDLRDALAITPMDRFMLETDSPYLTPEPFRGKKNTPANLPLVGERAAQVLDCTVADIAEQVWQTTARCYAIPAD